MEVTQTATHECTFFIFVVPWSFYLRLRSYLLETLPVVSRFDGMKFSFCVRSQAVNALLVYSTNRPPACPNARARIVVVRKKKFFPCVATPRKASVGEKIKYYFRPPTVYLRDFVRFTDTCSEPRTGESKNRALLL